MEQVFLTDQEFETISKFQKDQSDLLVNLGQVEYQLQLLTTQKSEVLSQLKELDDKNEEIGKELNKKYGNGTINMETKEFIKTE